jgi:osmotically-inducible protein OsmY
MHEQEVLEIRKALDSASIEKWYSVSFVSLSEGVLLQGLVDSSETSGTLERIVREVTGRQVINELKIRPRWQDHVVQQRLVETLELSHPDVHTRLDVQVADGVAHISGDLPNRRKVDAILATTLMEIPMLDMPWPGGKSDRE